VGLAGAGVAEQHDGLTAVDPAAGCERGEGGSVNAGGGGEVEAGEGFEAGEAGFLAAAVAAAGVARVDLGGLDLGEERSVGEPLAGGGVG